MKITKGIVKKPPKVLIWGPPGVGKSTFASKAPEVFFITAEDRTGHLDISRGQVESWEDLIKASEEFVSSKKYKTLVFDTVDALESLLFEHLAKQHGKRSHEDIGGGYFKYRTFALQEWRRFINILENACVQGIQTILLAHAHIKTYTPPEGNPYERWVLKLDQRCGEFLIEQMDVVGAAEFHHATRETIPGKSKAITTGERSLKFKYNPAYPSKQGIDFPDKMKLDWAEFEKSL